MQIQSRWSGFQAGALALLMVCITAPGAHAQGSDGASDGSPDLATDLEATCAAGGAAACLTLGERLFAARSAQADMPVVLALFGQACELGAAAACFRLGGELEFPDFGEADTHGAQAAYAQACALGLRAACERAGIAADVPPADLALPAPLPPAAAVEDASAEEAIVVGLAAAPGNRTDDDTDSFTGFASEALPDLDFGIGLAGPMAEEGAPQAEDALLAPQVAEPAEASEENLLAQERRGMAEACGGGQMGACEMYASWLRDGTGGPENGVRARRIFSVICTEGSLRGCYELGWMMYDAGWGSRSGLDTDELELSRARFLFSETCKAGISEACLQAADMRRNGVGGRVDTDGAARLYAIGCDGGMEAGCLMAPAADDAGGPDFATELETGAQPRPEQEAAQSDSDAVVPDAERLTADDFPAQ